MSAFVAGMTAGATLNARNPILSKRGTQASRPANSPQSVTSGWMGSVMVAGFISSESSRQFSG